MGDHETAFQIVGLEEVQTRFVAWRCEPGRTRRIHGELWEAAGSPRGEHSIGNVSRPGVDFEILRLLYGFVNSIWPLSVL